MGEYTESDRRASCFSTASDAISIVSESNMSSRTQISLNPLEKLVKIQSQAEFYLQSAFMSERARRWSKVVDSYTSMLKLIARPNMPPGFSINDSYAMLLYESFYHLGMALQNLDRQKDAVKAYTQALKAVNIHKNGCFAGCSASSCFQTPVLAKRAFAFALTGDMKKAMCDIEKAVVLDTRNSDLYCIRALLWNTKKDMEKAVDDLNRALRYNPCHVCALILRGTINQPFQITFNFMEGFGQNFRKEMKKDHIKAKQINPQAILYLDVSDIHNPKLINLWNKFLWSLNVPRQIMHVELMEGFNKNFSVSQPSKMKRCCSTPSIQVNGVIADESQNYREKLESKIPRSPSPSFRCGTPSDRRDAASTRRRHSYGEALRTFSAAMKGSNASISISRPQTATSVDVSRSRSISPVSDEATPMPRPPSEKPKHRLSVTFSQPLLLHPSGGRKGAVSAPPSMVHTPSRSSLISILPNRRRASLAVLPVTTFSVNVDNTTLSAKSKSNSTIVRQKSASEYAHRVHGIRVYEPMNVEDAPRMYYKPWTGDKLPVADIRRRVSTAVFRV